MKVEWLPLARSDRRSHLDYIGQYDPVAAARIGEIVEASVRRLGDHPRSGRVGRLSGTRELVVPRTSFIVIYSVEDAAVLIVRLLHAAQRWPPES